MELEPEQVLTMNQVVAFNVRRARIELREWSQAEACKRLGKAMGTRPWTVAAWSAMERSVDGNRIRLIDADLLVGLARAFNVPLIWFFLPPTGNINVGKASLPYPELALYLVPPERGNVAKIINGELSELFREAGLVPEPVNRAFQHVRLDALYEWHAAISQVNDVLSRVLREGYELDETTSDTDSRTD
jgi:transcriptional regulator with XRE-family HTH domain